MKKNRILIISIVLAIALVACPIESTRNITAGIGFILGAVSVAWLGVRQRKGARQEYEDTVRRYTGTTMMKVVWIEESVNTLAVDENVAGVGAVDAAQDVEQRGLAGAGRPQQHAEFAFFHGQVDAFQHLDLVFTAAKGLFDLIQFKKHRNAPLLVSRL